MSAPLNCGRLIDHVHLRVADLEASRRFYRAVLRAPPITDRSTDSVEITPV